jgi:6-pyruvoyltetrahydropterin/6-carboxytetrahydropterin synthase
METIMVKADFHAAHRQVGYPGECQYVHGHTWRGLIRVRTAAFPRDDLDMSLDFGDLKALLRQFDHKVIAVAGDPGVEVPAGTVVIPGRGPSVENVATYVLEGVVALLRAKWDGRGLRYAVRVRIAETPRNVFQVDRTVVV